MVKDIFSKYGIPSLDVMQGSDGFVPMEDGLQNVVVSEMTFEENKKQNGIVCMAKLTVTSGKYTGRYVKTFMNIVHPNAAAQEHGLREFVKLAKACGYSKETAEFDPDLYVGKNLVVLIGRDEPNAEGIVYNTVAEYIPANVGESASSDPIPF